MPLEIVQVQMKIFIKSSLVKVNTVCHLTLEVLTLFNCYPDEINVVVVVVLVLTALLDSVSVDIEREKNER